MGSAPSDHVPQLVVHAQTIRLAEKLFGLYANGISSKRPRILVGIAGIPGSGKSSIANAVANELNNQYERAAGAPFPSFAVAVPMDGFHLSRAQLAALPDPATAIHRRGAAFTYDAEGYFHLIKSFREQTDTTIYAPSFDHAIKDPVEKDIAIGQETQIVLFEGNYVALDREPWRSAAQLMDELWFLEVDREVARERLVKRHIASGICPDKASASYRIESTDFLNADDILDNMLPIDEYIGST